MTYTATDRQDGATATAKYFFTVHDPLEEKEHHINRDIERNVRLAGSPEIKNQSYTQSLEAPGGYVERSDSYDIGVSIDLGFAVSKWILDGLGISPSFTYTVTVNAGQPAAGITLPPRTYSYAVIYDTYERHWGNADEWDAAGFVGNEPFDFTIPRAPGWGIRMVPPIRLSDDGGGTGNSGG